jgi:murein DD-endopeptidase MepM/ murein hydrolase activator NlpD
MDGVRPRQIITSIFLFLLVSCANSLDFESITATVTLPTFSPLPSISPSPLFLPTATPIISQCDPDTEEYCIEEGTFYLQLPISLPGVNTVDRGYPYGSTFGGTRNPHYGVEFYNATGTPVQAAYDGSVFFAGSDRTQIFGLNVNYYGNLVVLKHHLPDQVLYTLYGHLSKIDVMAGQTVIAGEKIAEVGASGSAIGSHLHFEVRLQPENLDSTLNPELWLIPLPGTGVLALRFTDVLGNYFHVQPNVQYYSMLSESFIAAWQPESYDDELVSNKKWENVVLGNLDEGRYRISCIWEGVLYERWVDIQENKLTRVAFRLP